MAVYSSMLGVASQMSNMAHVQLVNKLALYTIIGKSMCIICLLRICKHAKKDIYSHYEIFVPNHFLVNVFWVWSNVSNKD